MKTSGIYRMLNRAQHYAWGDGISIPSLLSSPNTDKKSYAEYWMGAHPKLSSKIEYDGSIRSLYDMIEEHSDQFLGDTVQLHFKPPLPYLLKLLAPGAALSIQVHPNLEQAQKGFERENGANIAINSNQRTYRDANHKAEIICAITNFSALCGFRPLDEAHGYIEAIASAGLATNICRYLSSLSSIEEFYRAIMHSLDRSATREIVTAARQYASSVLSDDSHKNITSPWYWITILQQQFPDDIGLLAPLYLNIINLKPSEALFLPPNIIHSYLRGFGLELMSNSDNVIRGGLTSKWIDVPELLATSLFESFIPPIITPQRSPADMMSEIAYYPVPLKDFTLRQIIIRPTEQITLPQADLSPSFDRIGPEIWFSLRGTAYFEAEHETIGLRQGASLFIAANNKGYTISGDATLYNAAINTRYL